MLLRSSGLDAVTADLHHIEREAGSASRQQSEDVRRRMLGRATRGCLYSVRVGTGRFSVSRLNGGLPAAKAGRDDVDFRRLGSGGRGLGMAHAAEKLLHRREHAGLRAALPDLAD